MNDNTEKKRTSLALTYLVLINLLLSIAASSAVVYVYDRYFAVKVVSLDLKGYIGKLRDDYGSNKITEAQFKQRMDDLENLVGQLPANYVVLTSDVVVRNAKKIKP
jgi:hypothetical protein